MNPELVEGLLVTASNVATLRRSTGAPLRGAVGRLAHDATLATVECRHLAVGYGCATDGWKPGLANPPFLLQRSVVAVAVEKRFLTVRAQRMS